ncbi:MAG: hypothetical protein BGO55_06235 [Sphingobacteriales bacterium 50-39]|nr:MAG: hypothetical protein BGO55_06235 [Sphingobacteriales bacterium 50-39]
MWPFKRKKTKNEATGARYNRLDAWCNIVGHRIGSILQQKTKSWSPIHLKLALLLFVLIAGGTSIWVLLDSLRNPSATIRISPIQASPGITTPSPESLPYDVRTEISIDKIRVFHQMMDSLRNTPEGRRFYDSLRQARPGLFDSIYKVEQLYSTQERRNHIFNK